MPQVTLANHDTPPQYTERMFVNYGMRTCNIKRVVDELKHGLI